LGVGLTKRKKKEKMDEENIAAIFAALIGIIIALYAYFRGIETGWTVLIFIIAFMISFIIILLLYSYYLDFKDRH
jgi:fatty acid desaturase